MYKPLTKDFLGSAFNSPRNLIWIQDEYGDGSAHLVKETCELMGHKLVEVMLSDAWPIDLEELFNGLNSIPGIICVREMDKAHEYMSSIIYSTLLYYEFRRSSMSQGVSIPDSWKFVMITKRSFKIPDRSLYNQFLKLVNERDPLEIRR